MGSIKSLLKQTYDSAPGGGASLPHGFLHRAPARGGDFGGRLALGQAHVPEQTVAQMRGLLGEQGAALVGTMLESALRPRQAVLPLVLSLVAVMMGASGLVAELRSALNTVWDAQPRPGAD